MDAGSRWVSRRLAGFAVVLLLGLAASGCALVPRLASTNRPLVVPAETAAPVRATLAIDALRGNPRVLVLLALSGGGSRSAYFASQVMMKLRDVMPETDLLAEVDALSAVSGGSLPAAYYALSVDDTLRRPALARRLAALLPGSPALAVVSADAASGTVRCTAPLAEPARAALGTLLADDAASAEAVAALCAQARQENRRLWNAAEVHEQMTKNYLGRMFGNWLWPANVLRYWFSAFDRADIMAQTFADNLFDSPTGGHDFTFGEIEPARPYLILNSTNATEQGADDARHPDEMPFGSVFTFTQDDFTSQLAADIGRYSVARAVMASSAFPVVFPAMTLCDFRDTEPAATPTDAARAARRCPPDRYVHVFDGGNADNLGLKSLKRALLQMVADGRLEPSAIDTIVVLTVDAFATPPGTPRSKNDPRDLLDFIVDTNVTDAVDSLLRSNRNNLLKEFNEGALRWTAADCSHESRDLPPALCERLAVLAPAQVVPLADRMVFYHVGFDDVRDPALRRRLNTISTSFTIDAEGIAAIDAAVAAVMKPDNPCLVAIDALVRATPAQPASVAGARRACARIDRQPKAD